MSLLASVLLAPSAWAEETASRTWTAGTGHTAEGVVTEATSAGLTLRLADGREVEMALAQLVREDQEFLATHFGFELSEAPALPVRFSGEEPLTGLEPAQGEIHGPIEVEGNPASHYFLYLPTTLVEDRPAPMLVWSDAGGGSAQLMEHFRAAAERYGMIVCTCVEARNHMEGRYDVTAAMISEVMERYPVDPDRLYFSGGSGGGAFSVYLGGRYEAQGVMPMVGYSPTSNGGLPDGVEDWYWVGGGSDYNRYATANARIRAEDDGFHRIYDGGHGIGNLTEVADDGLNWMLSRWFKREGSTHEDEQLDFEARSLLWLQELSTDRPYVAYHRAVVLDENMEFSHGNDLPLGALIEELGSDEANVRYHEGLLAVDEFSQEYLAPVSSASQKGHLDEAISEAALELQAEYTDVPVIPDLFRSLSERSAN